MRGGLYYERELEKLRRRVAQLEGKHYRGQPAEAYVVPPPPSGPAAALTRSEFEKLSAENRKLRRALEEATGMLARHERPVANCVVQNMEEVCVSGSFELASGELGYDVFPHSDRRRLRFDAAKLRALRVMGAVEPNHVTLHAPAQVELVRKEG